MTLLSWSVSVRAMVENINDSSSIIVLRSSEVKTV